MERLIHMASWGIEYAIFSFIIIRLYRVLLRSEKGRVTLKLGSLYFNGIQLSDFVIFLVLTVIAAIRCNVGSDYYNYYIYFNTVLNKYNSIKDIFADSIFYGYNALSYIVKQFSENEYIIFAVVAIIAYAALFKMIRDESDDYEVSLACFLYLGFYANSLNIIKQYISMTFLLLAYFSLKNKHIVRCIIFSCIAITFHYSALIVIAIYILINKIEPIKILGQSIWLFGAAIGIFLPNILNVLLNIVSSASGYSKYLSWSRNTQIRLQLAVIGSCILYSVLCFLIMSKKNEIRKFNEIRYKEITFLLVGLLINIVGIRMWVIARISFYFYMFAIFLVPTYLNVLGEENRKKTKTYLYILLFVYSVFISIFLGENEYYSYSTIFSTQPMTIPRYNQLYDFLK